MHDQTSFTRSLRRLTDGKRADLLHILTSPSNVRADVIRQFHQRGASDMVELLVLFEEHDFKRATMISALRDLS